MNLLTSATHPGVFNTKKVRGSLTDLEPVCFATDAFVAQETCYLSYRSICRFARAQAVAGELTKSD
jgi:hypothetical protein